MIKQLEKLLEGTNLNWLRKEQYRKPRQEKWKN